MIPQVAPADPALLVKNWLKSAIAVRFPELQVRLELDRNWKLGSSPVVCVFNDGGPLTQWPVNTNPTIRVTSWTNGRDVRYANHILGLMLCTPIPGVAKVLPGSGVIEDKDQNNGADLASFTVRTRVRTVAL